MITLPEIQEPSALADWLEASLWAQDAERISDTAILDVFSEADMDDPDSLLIALQQAIRTRSDAVGPAYPFRRDGLGFARSGDWQDRMPYSFMLFASLNQSYAELNYTQGTANRPAELFEVLTSKAIERYLHCSVIRIGAPRRHPVPAAFPTALQYAADALGEIVGARDLEDHDSGDDGVDLIGWRGFEDARPSQALILAQCSIGRDWSGKRDGVSLELWRRHIDWHCTPLKGFAIPFHHQEGNSWRETSARAGIIFDRLRIARLVPADALPGNTLQAMVTWSETRLRRIRTLSIDAA
jgi:hypothetical protein